MAFQLRQAQKSKSKMRLGLSGPSGSGKTYSALLLASGIAPWEKICVIDTENGSADLYTHLGAYNVITLDPDYSPERYIEAIKTAENAGMEVIIVDSTSHEWDGEGGCLQLVEKIAQAKFKGNNWAAWSDVTPRHQKFIAAITNCKAHIITTARSKTDTIQTEDKKIKKVGLKEIQREGFEYELTANFTLDREGHYAIASKDRTGIFIDMDPFQITKETGEAIKQWCEDGEDPRALIEKIEELAKVKGKSLEPVLEYFKVESLQDLSFQNLLKVMDKVKSAPDKPETSPAEASNQKPQDDEPKTPETPQTPQNGEKTAQVPKDEEIDMDEVEAGIEAQKAKKPEDQDPSDFETEMDELNNPEPPKLITKGNLTMLNALIKRRAQDRGITQKAITDKLLEKLKIKSLSELTVEQGQKLIDMVTAKNEAAKADKKLESDVNETLM